MFSYKAPIDGCRFLLKDVFHVGFDAAEANRALRFDAGYRAAIVCAMGISRVRLLTNNPGESRALSDAGIEVVARIPCEVAPTLYSLAHLPGKKGKMGDGLSLRLTLGLT